MHVARIFFMYYQIVATNVTLSGWESLRRIGIERCYPVEHLELRKAV